MLSNTYVRLPMTVVKAKGALVFDSEGKTYIDLLSARSAGNLGHGNEAVINAIKAQAELLVHYSNDFHIDVQNRLNDVLVDFFPESLDHFYFSNSGTEIVEAAIKLARVRTGRKRVIGFSRGFHGRTMGALSLTSNRTIRDRFEPLVPGFTVIDDHEEALQNAVNQGDVAGIIMEPIRGEGGVIPYGEARLRKFAQIIRHAGGLFILDEIQTGFGRCGGRFYCETIHLLPDVLVTSKSVAGGMPLSILATRPELDFKAGEHGSTFSAHPVCCAAAIAAINEFNRLELALAGERIALRLSARLRDLASKEGVTAIRIVGAMAGIEIDPAVIDGMQIVKRCLEKGVLINFTAGRVIRLMPPLIIDNDLLDEALDRFLGVFHNELGSAK